MKTKQINIRKQGHIKKWQDDKGFGFIETAAGESVFFHVSAFKALRRPEIGEQVVFTVGQDNQGRLQAKDVQELSFVQKKWRKRIRKSVSETTNAAPKQNLKQGKRNACSLVLVFMGL